MRLLTSRPVLPPLRWVASPNHYKGRSGQRIVKAVVHVTVGSYASGVNWMSSPNSEIAAHVCLREDGAAATQLVAYEDAAWHAMEANRFSVGLEMAGFPDKESGRQLDVAARIVAFWCHHFSIPPRYAPEFSKPGFCRHGDLGVAGGNHPSCPMTVERFLAEFVPRVERETVRGGFKPAWGR